MWRLVTLEMMHSKKKCSDTAMIVLAKPVSKQFLQLANFVSFLRILQEKQTIEPSSVQSSLHL